jgi:hypothetical protein
MDDPHVLQREIAEKLLSPRKFESDAEADEALERENIPRYIIERTGREIAKKRAKKAAVRPTG